MAGNTTGHSACRYSAEIAEPIRSSPTPRRMQCRLLYHENDVASALELLTQTERAKLYRILTQKPGRILDIHHLTEYVQS